MRLVAEPYIPFALWIALAVIAVAVWVWYVVSSRLPVKGRSGLVDLRIDGDHVSSTAVCVVKFDLD